MGALAADSIAIKDLGKQIGFDVVRVTDVSVLSPERERYLAWVSEGRHAGMRWITPERARNSSDPRTVLPEARSVISVGLRYWSGHRPPSSPLRGKIARYAWGADYHRVVGDMLSELAETLCERFGGEYHWHVDTGPLMDRALAARAGVGWQGKNTNIIVPGHGSFVFLGEIVTTLALPADGPLTRDCGACRLCLVACPTGALGPAYSLDSRKCISYLTIEHRGPIPIDLRPLMGDWVFGCDICQDVCPPAFAPFLKTREERSAWSQGVKSQLRHEPEPAAEIEESGVDSFADNPLFKSGVRSTIDLRWLLFLTHEQYLEAFTGTAIRRAKVWMLRRNAAVALGNVGTVTCVADLLASVESDNHPIVRGHAAWALGQVARRNSLDLTADLSQRLSNEEDGEVAEEIRAALAALA